MKGAPRGPRWVLVPAGGSVGTGAVGGRRAPGRARWGHPEGYGGRGAALHEFDVSVQKEEIKVMEKGMEEKKKK